MDIQKCMKPSILILILLINTYLFGESRQFVSYNKGISSAMFFSYPLESGFYTDNYAYSLQDSTNIYTFEYTKLHTSDFDPHGEGIGFCWTKVRGERKIRPAVSIGVKFYNFNRILPTAQCSYSLIWVLNKHLGLQCGLNGNSSIIINYVEFRAGFLLATLH